LSYFQEKTSPKIEMFLMPLGTVLLGTILSFCLLFRSFPFIILLLERVNLLKQCRVKAAGRTGKREACRTARHERRQREETWETIF